MALNLFLTSMVFWVVIGIVASYDSSTHAFDDEMKALWGGIALLNFILTFFSIILAIWS